MHHLSSTRLAIVLVAVLLAVLACDGGQAATPPSGAVPTGIPTPTVVPPRLSPTIEIPPPP